MGMFDGILSGVTGGLLSGVGNFFGAQQANKGAAQRQEDQQAFEQQMSGTAYQRAVPDMIAAGLNPMLAYSQGGASTPSTQAAPYQSTIGAATQGVIGGSAAGAALANANAQNLLLQTQAEQASTQSDKNRADMNLSLVEASNKSAQLPGHQQYGQLTDSQIRQNLQSIRLSTAQEAERQAQTFLTRQHGTIAARDASYAKQTGNLDPILKSIGQGVGSASDAASAFGKLKAPHLRQRTYNPEQHN